MRSPDASKSGKRREILDRRRRRQAMDARIRALGEAADAAPAFLWTTGVDGGIGPVNQRWVDFVGIEPEPGGEGALSRVHPDDKDRFVEEWERAVRERAPVAREFRLQRRDGVWRWLLDTAEPRFDADGRYLGHVGAAVDVTRQREALDELRVSEARFRSFAEASDDLFWMADPTVGRIIFANSALERIWGASRQDLLAGFDAYWAKLIHPDDLPRVYAATATLQNGVPRDLQYRVFRVADGEERVVEDRAFPIRDETGAVRMVGGILRDITETVRTREELERRVAERTAELEASVEQRRKTEAALAQAQRLETVGRLTGGVAHDFNNLLTVIIGALDMILRRPGEAERVERLGQAALEAGRRGERLTRQLLSFSRRQPLRVEAVSLHDLILGFEPMLRGAVGEATPLSLDVPPELGANLDKVQFEAALLNLVVNARAAVEAVGGEVAVRAARAEVADGEIPELPGGEYVRVSVSDTGVGMGPEVAAHAFEPFFTTRPVGQGSGLGLAQVYGFARQSGGTARIDSTPGQGTTVSLYLPSTPPPAPVEAPRRAAPPALPRGLRVLLVDDEPAVRGMAEKLLLDLGAAVQTAGDGPSALAVLEQDPDVRLLLTDVVMPGGMDGVKLARTALARRPDLKVVLSTGYASDRLEAADPAWPVLFKPYEAVGLVEAVQAALDGGGTSTGGAL